MASHAALTIGPPEPGTSSRHDGVWHGRAWHNTIPMWITSDGGPVLRGTSIITLQALANRCEKRLSDGSLVGAFGGSRLIAEARVGRSTFWRHVGWLCGVRVLVVLTRGGVIRVRTAAGVTNVANTYGIPGSKGVLDAERVAREWVSYLVGDDGARKRHVIKPGAQAELWPNNKARPHRWDYPSPEPGLPQSRTGTLPSPVSSPVFCEKTMGGSLTARGGEKKQAGPRLPHFTPETIASDDGLHALMIDAECRGVLNGSDHERLMFCTTAAQALRIGRDPCAFFAAAVNRKSWRPTVADEEAGTRRLRSIKAAYGDLG